MDKKETNAEEARQNWHLKEMAANWKSERENQRDFTRRAIDKINAETADRIARIKAEADARIREAQAEADVAILAEKHKLQECLLAVARREDEYMHKFRNYIASLPKDEQAAYDRE